MKRHRRVVFWLTGGARGKLVTMALMVALIVIVFTNQLPAAKTWTYWTLPLSGKTIVLDPGHGGADGGAKSDDGLWEKDVTLNISMYLRDYLQQAGATVVMTRETDTDLADADTKGYSRRKTEDLKARAEIVRETKPDVFISVHLNSIPGPQWYGPQTFYTHNHKDNPSIAWFIQEELRTSVVDTHRQSKRIRNIFILDRSEVPTALVEVGFLSNAAEAANLAKPDYQKQLAAAIYRGMLRYASGEEAPLEPTDVEPDGESPSEEPGSDSEHEANPEAAPDA